MVRPEIIILSGFSFPTLVLCFSLQTAFLHKVKNTLHVAAELGLLQLQPLETDAYSKSWCLRQGISGFPTPTGAVGSCEN